MLAARQHQLPTLAPTPNSTPTPPQLDPTSSRSPSPYLPAGGRALRTAHARLPHAVPLGRTLAPPRRTGPRRPHRRLQPRLRCARPTHHPPCPPACPPLPSRPYHPPLTRSSRARAPRPEPDSTATPRPEPPPPRRHRHAGRALRLGRPRAPRRGLRRHRMRPRCRQCDGAPSPPLLCTSLHPPSRPLAPPSHPLAPLPLCRLRCSHVQSPRRPSVP